MKEDFVKVVEKYQKLRPENLQTNRFFINYQRGRCLKQVIGKNKIANMPQQIATFLNLPNPELYSGHCFRRTSATLLADAGADLTMVKRHGGWKSSTVAEGYIEDSIQNKSKISNKITETINIRSTSPRPGTSKDPDVFVPIRDNLDNQPAFLENTTAPSPTFTDLPKNTLIPSQISQTVTNKVNVPGKNVTLSFSNCSNFSVNF